MVQEAVEDSACGGHVAQELAPVFKRTIAGHDGGAVFVPAHDDFQEVFAGVGGQRFEAHVVNDDQVGLEVFAHGIVLLFEGFVLPIQLLLVAIAALWVADLRTVYESRALMVLLNRFFTWLASLCICLLTARGFLGSGQPGVADVRLRLLVVGRCLTGCRRRGHPRTPRKSPEPGLPARLTR